MSNYGRNFEFTVPPDGKDRKGRYYNAQGAAIPIGAPVVATGAAESSLGLSPVALAAEDANRPGPGEAVGGIAVYEYGPNAFAGDDPVLTTYSDKDTVPDGAAVQVVHGSQVKVRFRNTFDSTFLNNRSYTGRIMVAGIGATPTVVVGDFLGVGVGDDTSGYWKETATVADQWLVVTKVDNTRNEVEAQMLF